MLSNNIILSAESSARKMQRMAYEIAEHNIGEKQVILAGIKESGLIIAYRVKAFLQNIFNGEIMVIEISIDKKNPKTISIPAEIDFNNKVIIVTDDVSNSGRTLLYAVRPFLNFYPRKIQTLVLVARSHKQFPVSPDYVGLSVSTGLDEKIIVETEKDEVAGAYME
ncbi:MAG: phosphoribosyltransferase family protein [Ginsengibacter sp.]